MEDYTKYQKMNFKKKFKCSGEIWHSSCWSCGQFEYCINREIILKNAGINNLEYPSPEYKYVFEIKGTFDHGRFGISLDKDILPVDRGDIYTHD
jgi:hypothetical protein